MSIQALSREQEASATQILQMLLTECEAVALAICDTGGTVLARASAQPDLPIENAAALAAGSFAATRELAGLIGEASFSSIFHRGKNSGILITSLGGEFILLVVFGRNTTEGLVRLYLQKIGKRLQTILAGTKHQTVQSAEAAIAFNVQEKEIGDDPPPSEP